MADPKVRDQFVWHELMTTDTASAAAFYNKVIGWKTQPSGQDKSYTLFMAGTHQAAGLMRLPEAAKAMGAPPNWLTYIGTQNVDETARQAVALGAKILVPATDIPMVGRFVVLQDPQGAAFAAFTPGPAVPPPEGDAPSTGGFSWHELTTTDWRSAMAFYKSLFGWDAMNAMDMGPMGTYQMFGWDGTSRGGIFNKPKEMMGPPNWLPYISVADAKKTAEAVKKLGGKVANGPMEVPGGDWIVQAFDPQGAYFAVHARKAAAAAVPAKKKSAGAKKKSAAAKKPAAKPKPTRRAAAKVKRAAKRAPKRAASASRRRARKKVGTRKKR